MKKLVACASVSLALAGCQGLNDGLTQINSDLTTLNKALAEKNNAYATGGAILPSVSQRDVIRSQLSTKLMDRDLEAAKNEAAATIEKVMGIASCNDKPWQYTSQYLHPQSYTSFNMMEFMQYHPKNKCLTMVRLDGWKMAARNAIAFRAVFSSDYSGESSARPFLMRKTPEGVWLFAGN